MDDLFTILIGGAVLYLLAYGIAQLIIATGVLQ